MPKHYGLILSGVAVAAFLGGGCGLFDPRDPEDPTQTGLNYRPPTDHPIVITNLQAAVEQKNLANYVSCFSDPAKGGRIFVFIPSADAAAQYASALANWTLEAEGGYFQNMIARSSPNAFVSLLLTQKGAEVSADSVVYNIDYVLTFEHLEEGFPKTARGNLQFTITRDPANFWAISRWADYKTTDDATWSLFKGKFSN